MSMYNWARQEVQLAKAAKKCEKLPPDPLEHPELHSR